MDITVKSDDLARELGLARKVIETKTTIPILANVLMRTEDGDLRMAFTDTELGLTSACPATVSGMGAVTIPAKRLEEVARALPGTDLRIVQVKDAVTIKGAGFSARFATQPADDFPQLASPDGQPGHALPSAGLRSLIRRTEFAIGTKGTQFYIQGALLELRKGAMVMAATDAHRLAVAAAPCGYQGEPARALLPAKTVGELDDLLGALEKEGADEVVFTDTENHLFFEVGGRLLLSRKLAGEFPPYERLVPKGDAGAAVEMDRAALAAGLRRAMVALEGLSGKVLFSVAPGAVTVSAASGGVGEAADVVETPYAGEAVTVAMDARYVLDFLDAAGGERVVLRVTDEKKPTLWSPADDASYRYVVMPMAL